MNKPESQSHLKLEQENIQKRENSGLESETKRILLKEVKYSYHMILRGAGFDGEGNFMAYEDIKKALAAGITLDEIGISAKKYEEIKQIAAEIQEKKQK